MKKDNLAFVDGQNLYMSTTAADKPWEIDLARFRVYLRRKYGVEKAYYKEPFDKIVLVSGDGDYKMLVDFLIEENKFEKILFPDSKKASSLYKKITRKYFDGLERNGVKEKIVRGLARISFFCYLFTVKRAPLAQPGRAIAF